MNLSESPEFISTDTERTPGAWLDLFSLHKVQSHSLVLRGAVITAESEQLQAEEIQHEIHT